MGQTSTRPFMSIREGTDKRVSFNARDELGDKIYKLTIVMSKLAVIDNHERRPFKPQIYKSRGQNRSYGQGRYQPRKILLVSQHTRFEVSQKKEQLCHQIIIKFKHQGCVEICERKGISLSHQGWIDVTHI